MSFLSKIFVSTCFALTSLCQIGYAADSLDCRTEFETAMKNYDFFNNPIPTGKMLSMNISATMFYKKNSDNLIKDSMAQEIYVTNNKKAFITPIKEVYFDGDFCINIDHDSKKITVFKKGVEEQQQAIKVIAVQKDQLFAECDSTMCNLIDNKNIFRFYFKQIGTQEFKNMSITTNSKTGYIEKCRVDFNEQAGLLDYALYDYNCSLVNEVSNKFLTIQQLSEMVFIKTDRLYGYKFTVIKK